MANDICSVQLPRGMVHKSSDKGIHVFKLESNGMNIVFVPFAQGRQCVVHRLIESGSQCEDYTNLGATHALEHMMFKDGAPWERFATVGANLNAYTSMKTLATTAVLSQEQLMDWLTYQGECMRGEHMLSITPEQLSSEVANVLDEMHRNQSAQNVGRKMMQALGEMCMLQGNTFATIGKESTLKALTSAEDIHRLQQDLLGPSRNTLLVVGNVNAQQLINHVHSTFGPIPPNSRLRDLPTPEMPAGNGMQVRNIREQGGATNIAFGWPCPAYNKDVDVLRVIQELVAPDRGAHSLVQPMKDANIIFQTNMLVPFSKTPDMVALMASVPCNMAMEPQAVMRAERGLMDVLTNKLPHFSDQAALNAALTRVKHTLDCKAFGDAVDIADSVSDGIKSNMPSLHRHTGSRFAKSTITLKDIRDVSTRLLSQGNMALVRYLQNTLPPQAKFDLAPSHLLRADNDTRVYVRDADSRPVDLSDYVVSDSGVYHARMVRPYNKSTVAFAFPGAGKRDNWAMASVLQNYLNSNFPCASKLADVGATLKWEAQHGHMVARLDMPANMAAQCCEQFLDTIATAGLNEAHVKTSAQQVGAITNGLRYNADIVSEMKYMNRVYHHDDPNYIKPFDDRLKSIMACRMPHVESFYNNMVGTTPKIVGINVSGKLYSALKQYTRKKCHAIPKVPNTIMKYSPESVRTELASNPSCAVVLGQPCLGVQSNDPVRGGHLKLAAMCMGNGFSGKLMKIVRDQHGLTYSINCNVQSDGAVPSVVVNATFNPGVLDKGIDLTQKLMNTWAQTGLTQEELDVSRKSLMGKMGIYGLNYDFAVRHGLNMITKPNAADPMLMWHTIQNATLDEVNSTLRQSVKPGAFSVSVAGTMQMR